MILLKALLGGVTQVLYIKEMRKHKWGVIMVMFRNQWLQIIGQLVVGGICAIIGALIGGLIGISIGAAYPLIFAERGGGMFTGHIGSLIGIALGSFLGVWLFGSRKNKIASLKTTALFTGVGLLLSLILFNFLDTYTALLYSTFSIIYSSMALFAWMLPLVTTVIGFNKNMAEKEKTKLYLVGIVGIVVVLGVNVVLLSTHQKQISVEDAVAEDAESIARVHLEKYVYHAFLEGDFFTSRFTRAEVLDSKGCQANQYWEKWGQSSGEFSTQPCWEVRFHYESPINADAYLIVYVDKETGEVIGGTQTK